MALREPIVTSSPSSTSFVPIVEPTLPVPSTPTFIAPPPAEAYDRSMRNARATEATLLAELQERASVAAFPHVFPPERFPFPRGAVHERRGWRENGQTRVVPFPPNPLDVGYTLDF